MPIKRVYRKGSIDRRGKLTSSKAEISDAKVDVVLQRIEEPIGEELSTIPTHVTRYGVNNIFQRTLSYLLVWKTDGKPVKLAATAAGSLKVASTGAGLEAYERNPSSNVDGWVTIAGTAIKEEVFTKLVSVLDIMSKDYEIYIELSTDGVTYQPKKLLRGDLNHMKSLDFICKTVRLSNVVTDGTKDGSYEVVGYR